jgi:surface-anchored protein
MPRTTAPAGGKSRPGLYAAAVLLVAFAVMLGLGQQGNDADPEIRLDVAEEWVHLYPHTLSLSGSVSLGTRTARDAEVTWEALSGPGEVTFEGDGIEVQATFSDPGTYTLRVTATAGGSTASREVRVTVVIPAADYYVSPDGSDRNDGRTIDTPFKTIRKAASVVQPGDTVMLRGGVYNEYNVIDAWRRSGEPGKPITFMSYPGERAIVDGSHVQRDPRSSNPAAPELIRIVGLDWYVFDGIVFRNSAGRGLALEGSHHVVRNVVSHSNHSDGIYLSGSYNLVEDSMSFDNYSRSNGGDSADGIKITVGTGNVIRRFLAYDNSDDGIDIWDTTNTLVEYSAAFRNGRGSTGNGMGFKMGRAGLTSHSIIRFNVGFENRAINFTDNGGGGLQVYNNTSFGAGQFGFAVRGRTSVDPSLVANNISFRDTRGVLIDVEERGGQLPETHNNSWDLGIRDPRFVSLDPDSSDFLRLRPDSPAIDAGYDVGMPFLGEAIDLGAFEYTGFTQAVDGGR